MQSKLRKTAKAFAAFLFATTALSSSVAHAAPDDDPPQLPTLSDYGGVGLIEMRNARFMPDGELSLSATIKAPDDRVAVSFQALPWLEATFRYSINYALPPVGQRALYDRSFDAKIRLWEEGDFLPQFALGFQDILGTGVYSGEYAVASKSFGPVDATLGMGWGRLASRPAFGNPLGLISSRFDTRPAFTGSGGTPLINAWFRGPNVGLFGGLEYQTPIPKLTLKVEYSSDAYTRESDRQHFNYAPLPLNFGATYRFWSNVDFGLSYIGGKELAATLSISFNPNTPNFPKRIDAPDPFVARTDDVVTEVQRERQIAAGEQQPDEPWRVHFVDLTKPRPDINAAKSALSNSPAYGSAISANFVVTDKWVQGKTLVLQVQSPARFSRAALCSAIPASFRQTSGVRDIAMVGEDWNPVEFCKAAGVSLAAAKPQAPSLSLGLGDLTPMLEISRDDVDRMRKALSTQKFIIEGISAHDNIVDVKISNTGYLHDAEAIARAIQVLSASAPPQITVFRVTTVAANVPLTVVTVPRAEIDALADHSASPAEIWTDSVLEPARASISHPNGDGFPRFTWSIAPSVLPSAFDPDNPIYIGLGVSGSGSVTLFRGLTLGGQATYSIYNNFGDIKRTSNSLLPHVRTDIAEYLKKGASGIDDLTLQYTMKLAPELYARLAGGYIESMYAGVGGEVLYRPFGERWALGLDIWGVRQRSFDRLFGVRNYQTITGNLTLYFKTPFHGYEGFVSAGRYLAKDYGGTLELDRVFDSGIRIGAWMTLTNVSAQRFGEGSFDKGIRFVLPIEWGLPFSSQTQYQLALRPIQRDGGQPLDNARTLYGTTDSSSYGELERQWPHVFQ